MKTIADRYRLSTPIARGGMGVVWQGSDLRLNRPVAVKLIHEDDLVIRNEAKRRFYREARITARLRHPGVPVVYDFGSDGGELFMVMEYLEGHMVADLIAERSPLPVSWAALIGAQVCAVLAAAHGAGLIHRDIKPNNLVMCADATVKVIDRSRRETPPAVERPDVPEELEKLTLQLLAKSPSERPESAPPVFDSLLPLVKALPPLPGLIDNDLSTDPGHMYAAVIQHVGK